MKGCIEFVNGTERVSRAKLPAEKFYHKSTSNIIFVKYVQYIEKHQNM